MRILHVSEVHWGGVANLLHHFTAAQSSAGHDVHLLAPPAFPAVAQGSRHDWAVDRGSPRTFATAAHELRRLARDLKPDIIHLHSFVAGFIGRLPGVLPSSGAAVVYQPHAWSFDLFTDPKKAYLLRSWERWSNSRSTVLVANCADELAEGRTNGIDNDGYPIGVAIDLQHFVPPTPEERLSARHALGVTASRMILVLGRLTRQKGQDLLLAAWESSPIADTQLVLVGPGDQRPLADLAPSQWGRSVHAVGETHDVRSWIWACDLLLLPSRYETVSLVVAEAMACGVPVTATAVNGTREAVVDGPLAPAGEVVAVGDLRGLLAASAALLDDEQRRRAQSAQARCRAEGLFDPAVVTARLEDAYAAAIVKHIRSGPSPAPA